MPTLDATDPGRRQVPAIDPAASLASLVTAHPDLARELEARSLDYCCGGARSFEGACVEAGLDPQRTAAEIAAACDLGRPSPLAGLGPTALVDHLTSTHHAYLHRELPRLDALARKVAGVHGEAHPEVVAVARTVGRLRADLEPHLAKEELVLFPLIRRLDAGEAEELGGATACGSGMACGSVAAPIRVMLAEHDTTGELLAELRAEAGGYEVPADACASWTELYRSLAELEADVHLHVHKENNVLFPAVLALVHDPDGAAGPAREAAHGRPGDGERPIG